METNTWKLVKPWIGNVDIFEYFFMLIQHTSSMGNMLQIQTSFTHAWESTELNKAQASFTLVHHPPPICNNKTPLISKLYFKVASPTTNLDDNLTPLKLAH